LCSNARDSADTVIGPVPCIRRHTGIRELAPTVSECAETEHSSVQLPAGSLLTVGSKRNSRALGPGFPFVADAGEIGRLPLQLRRDAKQHLDPADM